MRRAVFLALMALPLAGCASPTPRPDGPDGAPLLAQFDRAAVGQFPTPRWISGGGTWTVVAVATAPSPPNALQGRANASGESGLIVPGGGTYGDIDASVRIASGGEPGARAGLAFHIEDAATYDAVALDLDQGVLAFLQVRAGKAAQVANLTGAAAFGGWHNLSLELRGPTARAWVDGGATLTAVLPAPGPRQVGLWVDGPAPALFDELRLDLA